MGIGIGLLIGALAGAVVAYFLSKQVLGKNLDSAVAEANRKADTTIAEARIAAERMTAEAEIQRDKLIAQAERKNEEIKQQKINEVRDRNNQLRSEFDREKAKHAEEMKAREIQVVNLEGELKLKQQAFKVKEDEVTAKLAEFEQSQKEVAAQRENLDKQLQIVQKKRAELDAANDERIKMLEKIASLKESEAREQLFDAIRKKAESEALAIVKDAVADAKNNANKEAKKIIVATIQRMAAEFTIENTVSVFNLENDEMKGQIIGREGRNIRALEAATGVELIVDDTPEAIVISSFDPVRREIARLSLQRLVADGRIHPQRIEEVVAKVRKQLDEQIMEIGERTVLELGIHGLNPTLVRYTGRMRFRSSYGQNLLKHSIETAELCALMAAELGMNPKQVKMAKRAGLLHDIGKVAEDDSELSHALYGMKICEELGEHPVIINAVGAHHDEIEMNNIISPIVQACDAISGARPGARREILDNYLKRIHELEDIAMSYDGVSKAFAMQAGRELRVIVEAEKVDDQYADDVAFKISQRIQEEMQYPGQIRVTVIREKRAVQYAR